MPIRINLLAEAQAEEELRRRDPLKRAIILAVALVSLLLLWSAILQVKIFADKSQLAALEDQTKAQSKQYDLIKEKEGRLADITRKLADLQRISANRFLWGSTLNALQQSTVPGVQLIAFRSEQTHAITEEVKPKTNEAGKITVFAKPGTATQRIRLQFDAKDSSAMPGDQVGKYKEALAATAYFKALLGRTNEIILRNLSAPSLDAESGRTMVMFSLDCRLPDKVIQ